MKVLNRIRQAIKLSQMLPYGEPAPAGIWEQLAIHMDTGGLPGLAHAVRHGRPIPDEDFFASARRQFLEPDYELVDTELRKIREHNDEFERQYAVKAFLHHYPQQKRAILHMAIEAGGRPLSQFAYTPLARETKSIELTDPAHIKAVADDLENNERAKGMPNDPRVMNNLRGLDTIRRQLVEPPQGHIEMQRNLYTYTNSPVRLAHEDPSVVGISRLLSEHGFSHQTIDKNNWHMLANALEDTGKIHTAAALRYLIENGSVENGFLSLISHRDPFSGLQTNGHIAGMKVTICRSRHSGSLHVHSPDQMHSNYASSSFGWLSLPLDQAMHVYHEMDEKDRIHPDWEAQRPQPERFARPTNPVCNCGHPDKVLNNGSGHGKGPDGKPCPMHMAWLYDNVFGKKRKKVKLSAREQVRKAIRLARGEEPIRFATPEIRALLNHTRETVADPANTLMLANALDDAGMPAHAEHLRAAASGTPDEIKPDIPVGGESASCLYQDNLPGDSHRFLLLHPGRFVAILYTNLPRMELATALPPMRGRRGGILKASRPTYVRWMRRFDNKDERDAAAEQLMQEGAKIVGPGRIMRNWPERNIGTEFPVQFARQAIQAAMRDEHGEPIKEPGISSSLGDALRGLVHIGHPEGQVADVAAHMRQNPGDYRIWSHHDRGGFWENFKISFRNGIGSWFGRKPEPLPLRRRISIQRIGEHGEPDDEVKHFSRAETPTRLAAMRDRAVSPAGAEARADSGNHMQLVRVMRTVLDRSGLRPNRVYPAIHDRSGGAHASIVAAVFGESRQGAAEYGAAWQGLIAKQPCLIVFRSHPEGQDSVYRFAFKGPKHAMSQLLDKAGVTNRIFVPHAESTHVFLYDPNRTLRNNVATLAMKLGLSVTEHTGESRPVGGGDDMGRGAYRDEIAQQESKLSRGTPIRLGHMEIPAIFEMLKANPYDRSNWHILANEMEDLGKPHFAGILREIADEGMEYGPHEDRHLTLIRALDDRGPKPWDGHARVGTIGGIPVRLHAINETNNQYFVSMRLNHDSFRYHPTFTSMPVDRGLAILSEFDSEPQRLSARSKIRHAIRLSRNLYTHTNSPIHMSKMIDRVIESVKGKKYSTRKDIAQGLGINLDAVTTHLRNANATGRLADEEIAPFFPKKPVATPEPEAEPDEAGWYTKAKPFWGDIDAAPSPEELAKREALAAKPRTPAPVEALRNRPISDHANMFLEHIKANPGITQNELWQKGNVGKLLGPQRDDAIRRLTEAGHIQEFREFAGGGKFRTRYYPAGHPIPTDLVPSRQDQILAHHKEGLSYGAIAKKLNISKSRVFQVIQSIKAKRRLQRQDRPIRLGVMEIRSIFEMIKQDPHNTDNWHILANEFEDLGKPYVAKIVRDMVNGALANPKREWSFCTYADGTKDITYFPPRDITRHPVEHGVEARGHIAGIPVDIRGSWVGFAHDGLVHPGTHFRVDRPTALAVWDELDDFDDDMKKPDEQLSRGTTPERFAKPRPGVWSMSPEEQEALRQRTGNQYLGLGDEYHGDAPRETWLKPSDFRGQNVPEGGRKDTTSGWVPVKSSWIIGIRRLVGSSAVDFMTKDGRTYRYTRASRGLLWRWLAATSKGRFWWSNIRDHLSPAQKLSAREAIRIAVKMAREPIRLGIAEIPHVFEMVEQDARNPNHWHMLANEFQDLGKPYAAHVARMLGDHLTNGTLDDNGFTNSEHSISHWMRGWHEHARENHAAEGAGHIGGVPITVTSSWTCFNHMGSDRPGVVFYLPEAISAGLVSELDDRKAEPGATVSARRLADRLAKGTPIRLGHMEIPSLWEMIKADPHNLNNWSILANEFEDLGKHHIAGAVRRMVQGANEEPYPMRNYPNGRAIVILGGGNPPFGLRQSGHIAGVPIHLNYEWMQFAHHAYVWPATIYGMSKEEAEGIHSEFDDHEKDPDGY